MNTAQEQALEFHKKYGCMWSLVPVMPSPHALLLRGGLIIEEAAEFLTAARKADMEGMCDALADLLYVTYGAAVVLGVDMEPIYDAVHVSNLTKDRGKQSCLGGKVLKGSNYRSPTIKGALAKQGWEAPARPEER